MKRKRDALVPIGEVVGELDVTVLGSAKVRPRRGTTAPLSIS